jgi:hypothetical protein
MQRGFRRVSAGQGRGSHPLPPFASASAPAATPGAVGSGWGGVLMGPEMLA